jgi:hypothetical protein
MKLMVMVQMRRYIAGNCRAVYGEAGDRGWMQKWTVYFECL